MKLATPRLWPVIGLVALAVVLGVWGPRGARVASACAFPALPQTYESLTYATDYPYTMDLAAYNLLFPGDSEFQRQPLGQGARTQRAIGPGHIPPVLLKSIGYVESKWQMGVSSIPYGGTGNALASVIGDCGYGIMQVTSGMTVPQGQNGGASATQALIATHYAYNIARGVAILANKWNEGADYRPIVGTSDPGVLEHWYFAVWGYNGFAMVNHPLSERYQNLARLPFSCNPNDALGHDRSQYPYQEMVYGCVANPPIRDGKPLWAPQPVFLPNLLDEAVKKSLDIRNFVYPYDKMDLPQTLAFTPDTSSSPPPTRRDALVGSPRLQIDSQQINLNLKPGTTTSEAHVATIRNANLGVGPWMAVSSASWLTSIPPAGVAIGSDIRCQSETAFCERQPKATVRVDPSKLKPGQNTGTLKFFSPQRPDDIVTVTVQVNLTNPGQTENVSRTLPAGCSTIGLAFPEGSSISDVLSAIQPNDAVMTAWRLPAAGASWQFYLSQQPSISTLKTVSVNDALSICMKSPATIVQSVTVGAGEPHTTQLQKGCSFTAVAGDLSAADFVKSVQPMSSVLSVWKLDTVANRWLTFLPASPFVSSLTELKRLDGVSICTSGPASLTQPSLAPSNPP